MKCFKKEFIGGYSPHESQLNIQYLKNKIYPIFSESNFNITKNEQSAPADECQLASLFFPNIEQKELGISIGKNVS